MKELVPTTEVNYKSFPMHTLQEDLVDILCKRTGREERRFFRVLVAYKFAEIAAHMRTSVEYVGTDVPVNLYAVNLSGSGFAKDRSMNMLDTGIFNKFRKKFEGDTFPSVSDNALETMIDLRVITDGLSQMHAEMNVHKEFETLPKFLYSFGASTIEGYKALRNKLSMSEIGATSFIIGEIGSSMTPNADALTELLNSYDMGLSKQKLIKNDSNSEMYGAVPSCLFMFGTQSKLFDAGRVEDEFFSLLEEGYGRRLFFGYVENHKNTGAELTPEQLYDIATDSTTDLMIAAIGSTIEGLADVGYYNQKMTMTKDVAMIFLKYRQDSENKAETFRSHEEIKKAVVSHGYWRAVKLAGAYAFVDEVGEISEEHAKAAIAMVEESNESFEDIAKRPVSYMKLIEYMADVERELTQVELIENLPFYKGSESQKKEMMTLAIAHGYRNKIVVKRTFADGVEFFKAERLEETDLDKGNVAGSYDITDGYQHHEGPFRELPQMVCEKGFHYTVNSWEHGHRNGDNLIPGFNLCVLDVDGGISLNAAKSLLDDYEYLMYETKRSTPAHNRFRVIIPLSHELKLDRENYKEFMKNIFEFMPFGVDDQTADCARKWMSNKATPHTNKGKMLDVYDFLPKTKKQEEMEEATRKIGDADAIQRYFLLNHQNGRNNAALNYGMMLIDSGHRSDEAVILVRAFNSKLVNPLSDKELAGTVFKSMYVKEAKLNPE